MAEFRLDPCAGACLQAQWLRARLDRPLGPEDSASATPHASRVRPRTPVADRGHAFESLGVAASVWRHGSEWFPLHNEPNPLRTEFAQGRGGARIEYNRRALARALRTRELHVGEHAGFADLFAPIPYRGRPCGVLVVGPFSTSPATAAGVLEHWRELTGRQGHPSDPAFADYLAATLAVLVLDGGRLQKFRELGGLLARLMAQDGMAGELASRIEALRVNLEAARRFERLSAMVGEMVDERTADLWQSSYFLGNLERDGLSRPPSSVLVGISRSGPQDLDPVEAVIVRNRFQRHMVERASELGETLAGRMGDHGIIYLSAHAGSAVRRSQRLAEVSERVSAQARREFGLALHFGACVSDRTERLDETYERALAAAQSALTRGTRLVVAERRHGPAPASLRRLRQDLARIVLERPEVLRARFDGYVETVAIQCGFRLDAIRGQLDAGFDRMTEPLVARGDLDEKSFDALTHALDRASTEARTTSELLSAYRNAVADVVDAVERPTAARQERSLRRAVEHIHRHYAEPLSEAAVAAIAGFTRTHFAKLFRQREKTTFVAYVTGLRLERAKKLLTDTDLDVARIAALSGFRSAQYFCRVFRHATGMTPLAHRSRGSLRRHKASNKN